MFRLRDLKENEKKLKKEEKVWIKDRSECTAASVWVGETQINKKLRSRLHYGLKEMKNADELVELMCTTELHVPFTNT
jgi:uncharacterized protein